MGVSTTEIVDVVSGKTATEVIRLYRGSVNAYWPVF